MVATIRNQRRQACSLGGHELLDDRFLVDARPNGANIEDSTHDVEPFRALARYVLAILPQRKLQLMGNMP